MASTKGKVVVLSYIYTHCTDLCPFITVKLKDAFDLLGADAAKTVFVAVTTDPKRDTPPILAAYSRAVGMYDKWRFVTGPIATMRKVWADYGVGVDIEGGTDSEKAGQAAGDSHRAHDAAGEASSAPQDDPGMGLSKTDRILVGRIIEEFGGGYEVGHSTPFWFVDPSGFIRVTLAADASPEDIARNVRALMTAK
jgi:cytochrome oxidase Cu insertion factor (SCO1/SenC/PrrC family)